MLMMTKPRSSAHRSFRMLPVALAVGLACNYAIAQDAEQRADALRKDLATPESRIDVGAGVLSGGTRSFGLYNGMNQSIGYGSLDISLIKREEETGTWFRLNGRNLARDNRELRLEHERQGDWAYYVGSRHLTRNDPLQINTGLKGIGTDSLTVSAAAPRRNIQLAVEHDSFTAGLKKFIVGGFEVRLSFKQDEKSGDRLYGQGTPGTMNFLTEPLDRVTRQWELIAAYADPKLQLIGGYSGSSFENKLPSINVAGSIATLSPIAAPPSNQAHQFHLAGGYNFGDSGRSSFKLSRSVATQNSVFVVPPALPGNRETSPGGRVVTTLAYGDLSLRPTARLDLNAHLRFEDRDDQSKTAQYTAAAIPTATTALTTAGLTGINVPRSLKQLKGQLEAGYQLEDGYRLIGSLEQEQVQRNIPVQYRRVAYRERTDETQARVEIKRMLSETLNGGLAYIHSWRGGSDYVNDTYNQQTNQVNPLIWANRRREKLRLSADWIPEESWSVQFRGDASVDSYLGRNLGPRRGEGLLLSTDVAYQYSEKWKLSAWLVQERNLADQTTRSDVLAGTLGDNVIWRARLRNTTSAWGFGIKGRPTGALEVGAELGASADTAEHGIQRIGGTGTDPLNPSSLPTYAYHQVTFKLFADYALDRSSGLRADLMLDRRRNNDWTWQNFTYSDGTTVTIPERQNVVFIGASYHYRWR